jgi:hypothetical protein
VCKKVYEEKKVVEKKILTAMENKIKEMIGRKLWQRKITRTN